MPKTGHHFRKRSEVRKKKKKIEKKRALRNRDNLCETILYVLCEDVSLCYNTPSPKTENMYIYIYIYICDLTHR